MGHDAAGGRQGMVAALCLAAAWVMAMGLLGWQLLVYVPSWIVVFKDLGVALPGMTILSIQASRLLATPAGVAIGLALLVAPLALLPLQARANASGGVLVGFAVLLVAALLVCGCVYLSISMPVRRIMGPGYMGMAAAPVPAPAPATSAPPPSSSPAAPPAGAPP